MEILYKKEKEEADQLLEQQRLVSLETFSKLTPLTCSLIQFFCWGGTKYLIVLFLC